MTSLLKKAFKKASQLSSNVQDEIARELLDDIESERRWQTAFDSTQEQLAKLADEAFKERRAGKTKEMGFDEL